MSYWNAPRDYQRERESAEREARVRKETPPEAEGMKTGSALSGAGQSGARS